LGDYLGLPPMRQERVIVRKMFYRNEQKRKENERRHQEIMRLLTIGYEEPSGVDPVPLENTQEMEKRKQEEDARDLDFENRLKEVKEELERGELEEEERRKEYEEWKETEDQ
ncbi:hypothetical protein PMAYCL1PPCAC_25519, partial [Pristionchus mayeri]